MKIRAQVRAEDNIAAQWASEARNNDQSGCDQPLVSRCQYAIVAESAPYDGWLLYDMFSWHSALFVPRLGLPPQNLLLCVLKANSEALD